MRILQISPSDAGGGAERIAMDLHREYLRRGHDSTLLVCTQRSSVPGVSGLGNGNRFLWKLTNLALRKIAYYTGSQLGFKYLFDCWFAENRAAWDVIHCHNLHGGYFPIAYLRKLGRLSPLVLTLHDEWLYTGHCACTFGCQRWRQGCGQCKNLKTYPPVLFDQTANMLKKRARLLKELSPTLVSPSKWLAANVENSLLEMSCKVIPNGIDLSKFQGVPKSAARKDLGLSQTCRLLLFVANGGLSNIYKGGTVMLEAMRSVNSQLQNEIKLIIVGGGGDVPEDLRTLVIEVGKIGQETMNKYYSAADILVYPTVADNLPLVPIEAMACGLPVIVSDIGGCSEIVLDGVTGYVVKPYDPNVLSDCILKVLNTDQTVISRAAVKRVEENFNLDKMAEDYLNLYTTLGHALPHSISQELN